MNFERDTRVKVTISREELAKILRNEGVRIPASFGVEYDVKAGVLIVAWTEQA